MLCPLCRATLPGDGSGPCPQCGHASADFVGEAMASLRNEMRAFLAAQTEAARHAQALDLRLEAIGTALRRRDEEHAAALAALRSAGRTMPDPDPVLPEQPPAAAPANEEFLLAPMEPAHQPGPMTESAPTPAPDTPPQPKPTPTPAPTPAPAPAPTPAPTPAPGATATFSQRLKSAGSLEVRLGQKLLLALGILVMLMGVGFFLKYSFDQGWVGPAGRVAGAYLWGMLLLGGGELARRRGYDRYGLWLAGGGIGVLYFASYAGLEIYALLPQSAAFALMALTTALAIALALAYDSLGLATLGLAGGFLSPALLDMHSTGTLNLYYLLLDITAPALALRKRWSEPTGIATLGTWYYAYIWGLGTLPVALTFIQLYMLALALAPALGDLLGLDDHKRETSLLSTVNALAGFTLTAMLLTRHFGLEYAAIASLGYCALFLALATALHRRGRRDTPTFPLALFNAGLFLVVTPPLLLSGGWITTAWAAIGAGLFLVGMRLERSKIMNWSWLVLAAALLKLFIFDYPQRFQCLEATHFAGGFFLTWPERSVTLTAVGLALWVLLRSASKARPTGRSAETFRNSLTAFTGPLLAVYLFAVLNIEVSALFWDLLPGARATAYSVLWTLFAVALMAIGFRQRANGTRRAALGLFALTLLKIFGWDVWNFSTPYRIVSFILLGLVLVGASFLYYKYKDRLTEAQPGAATEPEPAPAASKENSWQNL